MEYPSGSAWHWGRLSSEVLLCWSIVPFCFLSSLLALYCALGITTLQEELCVKISNPKTWKSLPEQKK